MDSIRTVPLGLQQNSPSSVFLGQLTYIIHCAFIEYFALWLDSVSFLCSFKSFSSNDCFSSTAPASSLTTVSRTFKSEWLYQISPPWLAGKFSFERLFRTIDIYCSLCIIVYFAFRLDSVSFLCSFKSFSSNYCFSSPALLDYFPISAQKLLSNYCSVFWSWKCIWRFSKALCHHRC